VIFVTGKNHSNLLERIGKQDKSKLGTIDSWISFLFIFLGLEQTGNPELNFPPEKS